MVPPAWVHLPPWSFRYQGSTMHRLGSTTGALEYPPFSIGITSSNWSMFHCYISLSECTVERVTKTITLHTAYLQNICLFFLANIFFVAFFWAHLESLRSRLFSSKVGVGSWNCPTNILWQDCLPQISIPKQTRCPKRWALTTYIGL